MTRATWRPVNALRSSGRSSGWPAPTRLMSKALVHIVGRVTARESGEPHLRQRAGNRGRPHGQHRRQERRPAQISEWLAQGHGYRRGPEASRAPRGAPSREVRRRAPRRPPAMLNAREDGASAQALSSEPPESVVVATRRRRAGGHDRDTRELRHLGRRQRRQGRGRSRTWPALHPVSSRWSIATIFRASCSSTSSSAADGCSTPTQSCSASRPTCGFAFPTFTAVCVERPRCTQLSRTQPQEPPHLHRAGRRRRASACAQRGCAEPHGSARGRPVRDGDGAPVRSSAPAGLRIS